jgi:hypothetical protein
VETARRVIVEPGRFFRAAPSPGGPGAPLLYAVVVGWLGLVAWSFYNAIFHSIVGSRLEALGAERADLLPVLSFLESWNGFATLALLGPVLVAVFVFAWAGLVHGGLLVLGGGRGGFAATFEVACYGTSLALFLVVPFCGFLVMLPYLLVVWVVGLAAAHGTDEVRGYAAILLAIVVPCCCLIGLLAVLGGLAGLAGLGGLEGL